MENTSQISEHKELLRSSFINWGKSVGILDSNGMSWSAAMKDDRLDEDGFVKNYVRIGCGFGADPDFNDGDW